MNIADRTGAVARLAVLALLWGSTFLWIKLALTAMSPVQVTLTRCVLGTLTLLVVCGRKGLRLPRGRAVWGRLFVAAFFCNALPFFLFSLGEQTAGSGVAGVLNSTTPLWSLLIGAVLGTDRALRPVRLAGLLLGFAGAVVIFAPWDGGTLGWAPLAFVAAAASYAIGFAYMGRTLVGQGIATIVLATAQLGAATVLTALTLPFGGLDAVRARPEGLAGVLALGVLATAVSFHLTYRIIADEGATNAATVGYLLPVVSVGLAAIVLGERITAREAAGMLVVLAGVAMTRVRRRVAGPGLAPTAAPTIASSHPAADAHPAAQPSAAQPSAAQPSH